MKILLLAIWTVMIAEIACGLRSAALTAEYRHPALIYLGTMIGTAIVMVPAVFLGDYVAHFDFRLVKLVGGLFFVLYGFLILLGKV